MEPMIKGYAVRDVAQLILDTPALSRALDPEMLAFATGAARALDATAWVPRREMVALLRAIAAAHGSDEDARRALLAAGRRVCESATTTFLRLLIKVLNPRMFANKFPELFRRDHQGGSIELCEVRDDAIVLQLRDVAGFDHAGPFMAGWIGFALEALGLRVTELTVTPWSRAQPGPPCVDFAARWN
jgi:hypothetical protein